MHIGKMTVSLFLLLSDAEKVICFSYSAIVSKGHKILRALIKIIRYSFIFHFGGAYVNFDEPNQTKRVQASHHCVRRFGRKQFRIFGNEQTISCVVLLPIAFFCFFFASFCIDVNKLI